MKHLLNICGQYFRKINSIQNKSLIFSILLNLTCFQLLYIPLVIYVPALAFNQVTGINLHMIANIVCAVCIFYTTLVSLLMRLCSYPSNARQLTQKLPKQGDISECRLDLRPHCEFTSRNPKIRHHSREFRYANYRRELFFKKNKISLDERKIEVERDFPFRKTRETKLNDFL